MVPHAAEEPQIGIVDLVKEVLLPGGRYADKVFEPNEEELGYRYILLGEHSEGNGGKYTSSRGPHGRVESPPRQRLDRMFDTGLGQAAFNIVGNEKRTLDILETLSADIMLEAARTSAARLQQSTFRLHEDMRRLFVPAQDGLPPTLLILDPETPLHHTRRITDELAIFPDLLTIALEGTPRSDEEEVRKLTLSTPNGILMALNITTPEVILTRRPRMERLSVPFRMLSVLTATEQSTAGILCVDSSGELGVTACYHGTGPVGTDVTIDGLPSTVKLASEVQDLVFVPLPQGLQVAKKSALKGVLADRAPSSYLYASFDGAKSGPRGTSISSHDAGLLRLRPSIQLKVQTPPDTDRGDSGAALVDKDGYILGFAFEKSAYGETPQLTDWIWAANALNALGLTPY